jgi:hypothetical protein
MNDNDYDFREDDTASKRRVTCKDSQTSLPIDLTGATVKLQWRKPDATLASVAMTVIDALGGVAEYQFLAGELKPPGMDFTVEITDSGGKIVKNVNVIYNTVRPAP